MSKPAMTPHDAAIRKVLTPEAIRWAKDRSKMKDQLSRVVIDIAAICDSHETLRATLTQLRTAVEAKREEWQRAAANSENNLMWPYDRFTQIHIEELDWVLSLLPPQEHGQ